MDKESFREIHRKAINENEDVMKRFYGVLTNGCAPSLLDCTSKEKNKGKITEQPFIFIGLKQTDDEKTRDVIAEIRRLYLVFLRIGQEQ